jgi:hypothetical protein
LITIAAIMMEASCEAVLGRDLSRDVHESRGATRLGWFDAWLLSLLRQALPQLYALLSLTLLLVQPLQLAVLPTCQPPLLCALLRSPLHFLRAPIGTFLTL